MEDNLMDVNFFATQQDFMKFKIIYCTVNILENYEPTVKIQKFESHKTVKIISNKSLFIESNIFFKTISASRKLVRKHSINSHCIKFMWSIKKKDVQVKVSKVPWTLCTRHEEKISSFYLNIITGFL